MRHLLCSLVALGAPVAGGCLHVHVEKEVVTNPSYTRAEAERVERVVHRLVRANNRGDVDAAIACYADDANWYPPGEPPIDSVEFVRDHYAELFETFEYDLDVGITRLSLVGDTAYVRGIMWGDMDSRVEGVEDREVRDNYEMILEKEGDDEWRIVRLQWWPADEDDWDEYGD